MKKFFVIFILSVLLVSCGDTVEESKDEANEVNTGSEVSVETETENTIEEKEEPEIVEEETLEEEDGEESSSDDQPELKDEDDELPFEAQPELKDEEDNPPFEGQPELRDEEPPFEGQPELKDDEDVSKDECGNLASSLDSCSEFKCEFVHPFTGETMEKKITGIVDGKCNYVEQMPSGGEMECNYTESQRKVAAKYYGDVAKAESSKISVSTDTSNWDQKITYEVDGKEVENPLNVFMNDGTCVISGY